jgi:hypothetical protein
MRIVITTCAALLALGAISVDAARCPPRRLAYRKLLSPLLSSW